MLPETISSIGLLVEPALKRAQMLKKYFKSIKSIDAVSTVSVIRRAFDPHRKSEQT